MANKSEITSKIDALQNVEGVKALPPGVAPAAGARQPASSIATASGASESDALALEQAGWTFVRPEDAAATANSVVVDADGRLKVVGSSLNVKIGESVPKAEAEALLRENGLAVRRELRFAPNLFVVESADGNPLAKARSLNELDRVEFAEPNLIEPIPGRS